jgi:predicted transcriptional regulator
MIIVNLFGFNNAIMDFRKCFYWARLSFTKAATELFITQPAVSKHIQELEEQYKVKLLIVQFENFPDSSWRTISKTCQEYF